ncbi:OmpP1/FadL family transporter [Sinomicrobium weinanense]|uniref:Long-chain fatty acid transport protein n=1 Tax=Sinomicrobium weinanense TaxID=2842200 RepID=A0A926JPC3_9FLAO|nr:hypothetical protein [Sinomicrobium weinanense]MBC9795017.1 hypothetical protein [Sinomicrobium weinanense]MBU3125122.1 hypothetical protein [Sinomicrobium weinanense]
MKKLLFPVCFSLWFGLSANAQSEGLTGSPYSMYGLGTTNQLSLGKSNALGRSGIALPGNTEINNQNPASYASVFDKSFLFDVGFQSEYNHYSNKISDESKWSFNFSNLAFAFSLSKRSGIGLTLIPYTNVGYTLLGVSSNIEGSDEQFKSTITGVGGLNALRINYGYRLSDKIRLGVSASYLFGSIEENEFFSIGSSYFEMNEDTFYNGFRPGLGLQYDITKNFSAGATVQFPVSLQGNMDRTVTKTLDGASVIVEDQEGDDVPDFKLPTEAGIGIYFSPFKGFSVNADYRRNFWSATEQTDNIGKYKDQDIFGIGVEYLKDARGLEYTDRIRYRAGFTANNGYLSINNKKVGGYAITAGLGLPINPNTHSMLNISYSYGQKGQLSNILVKENYHFITLNVSLEDLWFIKRKYD